MVATDTEELPLRIHVLRRLNPVLACILKSPLHGLASRRLLLLSYRGRKSGKLFTIPLVYVRYAEQIYCVTRNTQWWKSAVSAPSVAIWHHGQLRTASAERAPSDHAETRAAFARFLAENPGTASLLYKVRIDAEGQPDASDIHREVYNSQIIRLTVLPEYS
jgi:hypothetical protein